MTSTYITPETVTDEQIAQLRDEAGAAADHVMATICDIALGGDPDPRVVRHIPTADRAVFALGLAGKFSSTPQARAECARVIADARAQE